MYNRNRFFYFCWIISTVIVGLLSRTPLALAYLPDLGDILYAFMFYGIIAFLLPKSKPIYIGFIAIGCCYLVECSQLYEAEWFNLIRNNRLGRLVFGYGFGWKDLLHYTIGGVLGAIVDSQLRSTKV